MLVATESGEPPKPWALPEEPARELAAKVCEALIEAGISTPEALCEALTVHYQGVTAIGEQSLTPDGSWELKATREGEVYLYHQGWDREDLQREEAFNRELGILQRRYLPRRRGNPIIRH